MNVLTMTLAVAATAFLMTSVFLFKMLKQTKANLQELLRETEAPEQQTKVDAGDIYFKTDEQFTISFAEESGIRELGYTIEDVIGRPLLHTLAEDNEANREFLQETFDKLSKKPATFNTQMLIRRNDGKNMLVLTRIRPILDEILQCRGLSFLCKDIALADSLNKKLDEFQSRDPFTDVLNEQALRQRFEHDFKLATRYNKELSAIVVELRDIYEFAAKGIDFETADKILKDVGDIAMTLLPEGGYAGRVDKTKIVMIMPEISREEARQAAVLIFDKSIAAIRSLRIDSANAQMIVISYSNRKGFTDSYDAMAGRLERHINLALKHKDYGIVSSDSRTTQSIGADLENIKS